MLAVDGLTTSYGAIEALRDVSFTVADGSITAVLGANGAGKTTLLRSMTGLVKPQAGTVRYDGTDLLDLPVEDVVRHGVAHVPEGRSVVKELTVDENLRLGGVWRSDRPDRRRALDEVYELFPQLTERRRRAAFTLSGGESQMLAIGRALMSRPRLLLLDEPSLGLAPLVVASIMRLLRTLTQTEQLTVLLVEQNARTALSIADRAVVLYLGRVVLADDARKVSDDADLMHHYLDSDAPLVARPQPPSLRPWRPPLLNETLNGITSGAIYASIALALVLIWRGTRIVNFAAGAMAMVSAFIALSVIDAGAGYWLAFLAALAFGLVAGAVVERVLVRPVESKPPLTAVILTFGLLILIEAIVGMIWGEKSRALPAATFSIKGVSIGGQTVALSPFDLFVIGAVLGTMVLLIVLFRATNLGLKMRAAAFQPEIARLLGVRVGRMLTLGWALASLVGALAGVLVAPKVFLSPNFMDAPLVYGFSAAVIGGLDSPVGAVAGGLALGLVTSYVGGWQVLGPSLEVLGARPPDRRADGPT